MEKLDDAHPDLRFLFTEVAKRANIYVLWSYRSERDQNEAYKTGKSKLPWPQSKHNCKPSLAVDVTPDPLDWDNLASFKALAEVVKAVAKELGINVEWGGDWHTFKDYPHWQIKT